MLESLQVYHTAEQNQTGIISCSQTMHAHILLLTYNETYLPMD